MSDPLRRVTPVVRIAPAKVNLTLAVVGRRPDGFHALHSVMVPLDLADRLAMSPAFGPEDQLHVVGPDGATAPDLGPLEENLALRALAIARRAVREAGDGRPLPPLAIRLEKRIPTAAGLAGGSSDGAAAFSGALEAWGAADAVPSRARQIALAALGSDCAFFDAGGWALVEGRGERVTPLPAPRGTPLGVVVVTPTLPVSTQATFACYASGTRPAGGAALASSNHLAAELRAGLTTTRFLERAGVLAVANDLVPATSHLVPALVPARRALGGLLGRPVGQSGSGPTLWVLAPSRVAAEEDAALVRAALADGRLVLPGVHAPFVTAAAIVSGAGEAAVDGMPGEPSPPAAPARVPSSTHHEGGPS